MHLNPFDTAHRATSAPHVLRQQTENTYRHVPIDARYAPPVDAHDYRMPCDRTPMWQWALTGVIVAVGLLYGLVFR